MSEIYSKKQLTVESTWTQWLLQAFKQSGFQNEQFMKEFGDLLDDAPTMGVDIGRIRSVYHWVDKMSDDPILGVRLSQLSEQRSLGVLSPLGWHAPNLREILNVLVRFYCVISGNADFLFLQSASQEWVNPEEAEQDAATEQSNTAHVHLCYQPRTHTIPPNRHQSLLVTCVTLNSIRAMTRRPDSVVALGLPRVLDPIAIGASLNCVTYNNNSDTDFTLIINGKLLDVPINGRDERLYSVVFNHAIARENEVNQYRGLADDIGAFVRSHGFNQADMVKFCELKGLHPRELQRTLSAQGLTFRQLRQKETRDMAMSMLMQGNDSISQIALALGYSEPASFARACTSWFDRSPSELRKSGWMSSPGKLKS